MTENIGNYVIVGTPKTKSTPAIKYMKYAVLMNANSIRILLIQNTKVALDVNLSFFLPNLRLKFFSNLKGCQRRNDKIERKTFANSKII